MEKGIERKRGLWLAGAMAAPLSQFAGKVGWVSALVISAAAVLLLGTVKKLPEASAGTGMAWTVWITVHLAWAVGRIPIGWKVDAGGRAAAWVLLFLAAFAVSQGRKTAERASTVLALAVLTGAAVIGLAAADEVRLRWLKPEPVTADPVLLCILLMPAAATDGEEKGKFKTGWLIPVTAAMSVLLQGVLSGPGAAAADNGLYEVSRTVSVFTAAKRFESVISAACLLSWFLLLSLLLWKARACMSRENRGGIWLVSAAAAVMSRTEITAGVLLGADALIAVTRMTERTIEKSLKKMKKGVDK